MSAWGLMLHPCILGMLAHVQLQPSPASAGGHGSLGDSLPPRRPVSGETGGTGMFKRSARAPRARGVLIPGLGQPGSPSSVACDAWQHS